MTITQFYKNSSPYTFTQNNQTMGYLGLGSVDGAAAVCSAALRFTLDNPAERITLTFDVISLENEYIQPGVAIYITDSPVSYKNIVTAENADATADIYSPGSHTVTITKELEAGNHWLCIVPHKAGLCTLPASGFEIFADYTYIGIIKNAFADRYEGGLRIYAEVGWSDNINHEYNLTYEIAPYGQGFGSPHTLAAGAITDPGITAAEDKSYNVRITLSYAGNKKRQTEITVPSAGYALFLKAGGKGAAFGKAAEADNTLEIAKGWAIKLGDVTVTEEDLSRITSFLSC